MIRASSALCRTLAAARGGAGGCATTFAVPHRFLGAALYGSCTGNTHFHRRWFSLFGSFTGSSAQGASLGVAGALITVVAASSISQEVHAKEPPPPEVLPKDVVLYQYEACPFCNKVKAFLDYYDIPYKVVEVNPISKKEIKWSEYQKVPILMVDGEQLNDSSAIIDKLGEKIPSKKKGDSTSEDDEETKWRRWVDNHLVHVLSPNIYRNASEALESFDYITSNGNFSFTEKITVKYAGAAAMYFVSKNLKKKYNIVDERAALYEAAEQWVDALNGREFLGGSKPNLGDLAVFGVLRPIRYLSSGKDMVKNTRIGEWYTRMENAVGEPSRIKAFDIDGHVATFGHPDWARTHEAASRTSPAVSALVEGGATCIGTTIVDELAYGISGENKHYGTPNNPAVPARVPGGSSSGAAVAVAAKLVDFSLGIDTIGGVRVPAGFCGILGFRPSYGAVSNIGIIPVSTSLDTVGWFAKDPSILRRVGHILLQASFVIQRSPQQIIIADDCFKHLNVPLDRSSQVVIKSTEKLFGRQVLKNINLEDYLSSRLPSLKQPSGQEKNGELKASSLKSLAHVMQFLQGHEFRVMHEEWMNIVKPDLHPAVSAHLHEKLEVSDVEIENFKSVRNEMRAAVNSLLKEDGVLVIPTVADPPPKLGRKEIVSKDYQSRAFSLLNIASLSGCCQVTIPLGFYDKCPISVSLIARHGGDCFLLDTVQTMYTTLLEQADISTRHRSSKNVVSQEESAEIAKEKGNEAYKSKQWQKAIGFYTEAIKLSGNNATYYSNRAQAYLELGSYLQAEADCTKAINLDKKNVKAYFRRGTAKEMLGYYKEAIDDFKYALVLEPTNKRAASAAERLRKLFL